MTFEEALSELEKKKVKSYLYVHQLGALGNGECIGMESIGRAWRVYYSERGEKSLIREFESESEAAFFFVEEAESCHREYVENLKSRKLPIPE